MLGLVGGAELAEFGLNEHGEAVENAARYGGWGSYTTVTPRITS